MTAPTPARCDISLVVNTHQRPRHLGLVLASIAAQEGVAGRFDVVVSDDGSTDDTATVVAAFAARVPFPVRFSTEQRDGFRLARVRNRGALLAGGEALLFLDGDCILPPDHVAAYLARRRRGTAQLGYCVRLPEEASRDLEPGSVDWHALSARVPRAERAAVARRLRKQRWHSWLRHPTKPRLAGGNFAVWRDDYVAVNGFDERFCGWGQEDDDLGLRLRAAGVRLEPIIDRTMTYHVWHPTDPSATPRWRDGANVGYFLRRGRLTKCRAGLVRRLCGQIVWGLPPDLPTTAVGRALAALLGGAPQAAPGAACEIDVVIRPGSGTFRRRAECRVVLLAGGATGRSAPGIGPGWFGRRADRVVSADPETLPAVLDDLG
jgi:GT2 family glycosyltransferase